MSAASRGRPCKRRPAARTTTATPARRGRHGLPRDAAATPSLLTSAPISGKNLDPSTISTFPPGNSPLDTTGRRIRINSVWLKNITMWVFDQPRNAATMTTSHVMRDGAVITRAYHDENDHGWQFYSEHVTLTKDSMIVVLDEIVALDQSVTEISDLPPGWMAQRTGRGFPWHRTLQYADAAQIIVDWSKIMSEEDFYDTIFPQCGSPAWHGRNLDALADSWITGGIDKNGPPYAFGFYGIDSVPQTLIGFRDSVLKIAEESIDENGGRHLTQAEMLR